MADIPSAVRIVLLVINSIHLLMGGVLLGIGIWGKDWLQPHRAMMKSIDDPVSKYLDVSTTIGIIIGGAITHMGYLTLGSVVQRNRCMLYNLAWILAAFSVCEIAGLATLAVHEQRLPDLLATKTVNFFKVYSTSYKGLNPSGSGNLSTQFLYEDNFLNDQARSIDYMQTRYGCCGINGLSDYEVLSDDYWPVSCCQLAESEDTLKIAKGMRDFYQDSNEVIYIRFTVADQNCPYNWNGSAAERPGCLDQYLADTEGVYLAHYICFGVHIVIQVLSSIMVLYLGIKSPHPIPCCPQKKTEDMPDDEQNNTELSVNDTREHGITLSSAATVDKRGFNIKQTGYVPTKDSNKPWYLKF